MKIRTNKKIQAEVDRRQGHTITHLTALHVPAVDFNEDTEATNSESFSIGVEFGMKLLKKYEDRVSRTAFLASDKKGRKTFGIYLATQETSDGDDLLYFIGTPDGIVERLKKIPATE